MRGMGVVRKDIYPIDKVLCPHIINAARLAWGGGLNYSLFSSLGLQLSWRAHLLLELLQSGLADCHCCEDVMPQLSNICLFIVRDCLAEREADASEVPTLDIMGCLQKLERNRCADMMIFRELAELWSEGSSENFQKCVPLIAQLVKDTFPHVDTMEFDTVLIRKGVYQCHPRSLKRVASFKGNQSVSINTPSWWSKFQMWLSG